MVEEASFQEEMDQGVEGMPDEEEAVAARGRRREGLERGRVGHAQDDDGRGKGHECGLVEQVWREAGVCGCRVACHRDQYGVDEKLVAIGDVVGIGLELKLQLSCETRSTELNRRRVVGNYSQVELR